MKRIAALLITLTLLAAAASLAPFTGNVQPVSAEREWTLAPITPLPPPTRTPTPTPVTTCWVYKFEASNPFPNPAGNGTNIKQRMNLVVLGGNGQLYPATLFSAVYNLAGQLVKGPTNLGSYASNPSFDVIVWTPNVASGTYFIKTWAQSSICGTSPIVERQVSIIN